MANGQSEEAESKTAKEFANGTVLKLLKENNGDKRTGGDPWDTECKYPARCREDPAGLCAAESYNGAYARLERLDLQRRQHPHPQLYGML